jgi:hypothetical protein
MEWYLKGGEEGYVPGKHKGIHNIKVIMPSKFARNVF